MRRSGRVYYAMVEVCEEAIVVGDIWIWLDGWDGKSNTHGKYGFSV